MIIVSACLTGIKCRWDGGTNLCDKVVELVEKRKAIPVCPEQLGGLSTPRLPCEQIGKKVITKDEIDVTENFRNGAKEGLKIAKLFGAREAILKSNSPSCGSGKIYDGSFSNKLIDGDGVFTKLLEKNNVKVITEIEL